MQDRKLKKLILFSLVVGVAGIVVAKYFSIMQNDENCETKKIEVVANREAIEILDEKACGKQTLDN